MFAGKGGNVVERKGGGGSVCMQHLADINYLQLCSSLCDPAFYERYILQGACCAANNGPRSTEELSGSARKSSLKPLKPVAPLAGKGFTDLST